MYGASPNVIAITNETPLDVATGISKTFEMDAISELLIRHGSKTTLQSQRRNKPNPESSFLISDELQTTLTSLQTTSITSLINSST